MLIRCARSRLRSPFRRRRVRASVLASSAGSSARGFRFGLGFGCRWRLFSAFSRPSLFFVFRRSAAFRRSGSRRPPPNPRRAVCRVIAASPCRRRCARSALSFRRRPVARSRSVLASAHRAKTPTAKEPYTPPPPKSLVPKSAAVVLKKT